MFSRNPFLWRPLWLFSSFKLLIPWPEIYLPSKCLLSLYLTFIPRELRDSKERKFVSSTMVFSNVTIVATISSLLPNLIDSNSSNSRPLILSSKQNQTTFSACSLVSLDYSGQVSFTFNQIQWTKVRQIISIPIFLLFYAYYIYFVYCFHA